MILAGGRRFLVVGHRGAAARAPENTAASIRAGLDAGADAIEFDVGLSSDGRAVVLHDATLDRTTDGRGSVDGWDWRRLSELDAGGWFARRFRGERLLDLDGALALVRSRAPVVVEIKGQEDAPGGITARDERLAGEVVAALARTGGFAGASVSSSHWALLDRLSRHEPGLDLALTVRFREGRDPVAWAGRMGASALHPNRRLCSPRWVARAAEAGLAVIAYTVNRAVEARAVLDAGAHGVFTDDPGAIARWLRRSLPAEPDDGDLLLGIDQGSGGTRAALVGRGGRIVAVREARVASRRGRDGGVVLDAEAVAASVSRAVIPLLERAPRRPVAAGIAAQRGSVLVWTRAGTRPVSPVLSWRVGPNAGPAPVPGLDEAPTAADTGLTTRYPYGAYRLARLMAEDPGIAKGLREGRLVAGPLGSFLAARFGLGQDAPADPSLAQRTLLLDLAAKEWNRVRAGAFGIPVEALPPVRHSVDDHGTLRFGGRRLPLRALVGDVGAAVRATLDPAAGVFPGWSRRLDPAGAAAPPMADMRNAAVGALILGTGGFLVAPTGARRRRVPGLLTSVLWADGAGPRYAVEATVHGLAASLVRAAEAAGLPAADLSWVASRSGRAARTPRIVAAPEGRGTPWWDPTPRFEIEEGRWTDEEIVRGTVAALAETFAAAASPLREASLLPESFVAAGGLAASPHLVAALGRAMGTAVVVDPRPHRTAVGAALLAGDGLDA